jgi:hypothetical protein
LTWASSQAHACLGTAMKSAKSIRNMTDRRFTRHQWGQKNNP